MGDPQPVHRYTVAEYLALEEAAEYRSEYFEGEIFAMAGGTEDHSLVVGNCITQLNLKLSEQPCRVYPSDTKVRIEDSSAYYYPDVSVACEHFEFEDTKRMILTNPVLLVEVLSDSTAEFDRGKKFTRYRQISSLREYVLISQHEPAVDVFYKTDDSFWRFDRYNGLDDVMELRSLGIQIKLADIYRRVEFAAQEIDAPGS
jgi:Uma2 family endonuclease